MFKLPELPYSFDALEPHVDAKTMEIHHDKHHAGYVANLNKALESEPICQDKRLEDMLRNINSVPEKIRTAVRNNGGGHYNHSLFWQIMKKNGGGQPKGNLAGAIVASFGDFEAFKTQMTTTATTRFGSGWAWLAKDEAGKLTVYSTPNQDNPLMDGKTPLLGVDVWEHAYYLKYQNRRPDYLAAWWNTINWDKVGEWFDGKTWICS